MTPRRVSAGTIAVVLLAGAMATAAVVIGISGHGQTLKSDEWGYAERASRPLGDALFEPPARKYLLAVPMLFYEGLFNTAGTDHYFPYQALGIVLLLLSAGLFYALARRGLGDLWAIPPTIVILFLGSAWDVVVTPLRVPELFSISAGLGMLLCLERRDLRGDLGAALLLLIGLTSHPSALAFAVAAIAMVVLRPARERWRHSWTVLVPIGLYGSWWLFVRNPGPAAKPELGNLPDIPKFCAQSFAGATSTLTGVAGVVARPGALSVQESLDSPLTWIVAVVFAGLLILAILLRRRSGALSPMFWAVLSGLVALWVLTTLAPRQVEVRSAASGRYLYPSVLLLLLLVAELARGIRLSRAAPWLATGVLALGFVYNITELNYLAARLRTRSDQIRAYLGALELARGRVAPTFLGDYTPNQRLTAATYFTVAGAFGTPAATPAGISRGSLDAAVVADHVLAQALRLQLSSAGAVPPSGGTAPKIEGAVRARTEGACVRLLPTGGSLAAELVLPPGGAWLQSRRMPEVSVRIGRFGPAVYPLTSPPAGNSAALKIPRDRAPDPWSATVTARRAVTVCGLPR